MATRAVAWPRDIFAVARSLSQAEHWFWLDGAAPDPDGTPGHSYLGQSTEVEYAKSGQEHQFLERLRSELADVSHPDAAALHDEPRESRGQATPAFVVAFAYEFGVALMGRAPINDACEPAFALRTSTVLVLDHASNTAELRAPSEASIDAWLVQHGHALAGVHPRESSKHRHPTAPGRSAVRPATWRSPDADYLRQIEHCMRAIRDGQAYVLCLTDTAEQRASGVRPLALYAALREGGTATRGAVITSGDRALVSVSPERFLSVHGRTIETHPIKGTRPRAAHPETDALLAAELVNDPKERAENLMIVDLMRNDLSRVCEPASIATAGFLRVETHARVHQLVSTVRATLREGFDVFDALRATFPGGSMTGAPKSRAVQLLAQLEKGSRGLYSGCFGFIASNASELAMSIRCIELRDLHTDRAIALVGAGGGITSDSDPAAELAEKHLKAAPLLAAIELAQNE